MSAKNPENKPLFPNLFGKKIYIVDSQDAVEHIAAEIRTHGARPRSNAADPYWTPESLEEMVDEGVIDAAIIHDYTQGGAEIVIQAHARGVRIVFEERDAFSPDDDEKTERIKAAGIPTVHRDPHFMSSVREALSILDRLFGPKEK